MGATFCQLKAVLWKAFCSRKFHYIYTCLDIVVPLLLAYLLIAFKGQTSTDEFEREKIFKPYSKTFLLKSSYAVDLDILYTPNSPAVNAIMANVKNKLNNDKIVNYLAMDSENEMEEWLYNKTSNESTIFWHEQSYGIVFHTIENNNLNYSIKNSKFELWSTKQLFPESQYPGPMESGNMYIEQGFMAIQIAIDEAFMESKQNKTVDWNLQEFPYPEYKRVDKFSLIYKESLPLLLCYGFLFTVMTIIKTIGEEKESGIRERLKMIGVKPYITYVAWIIDRSLISLITSALLTLMFTASWISKNGAILEKPNFLILWITLFLFYACGIFMAIAIANLFNKPKYSVSVGLLIWLVSFGLMSYLLNKKPSAASLFFACMIPNGYLLTSLNAVVNLEVLGVGATFSTLFKSSGRDGILLPLGMAWLGAILGCIIFTALILYLDAVLPGQYGIPKPWYFVLPKRFLRAFCKVGPLKTSSIVEDGIDGQDTFTDDEGYDNDEGYDDGKSPKRVNKKIFCEPLLDKLPIGIQIRKLTKKFGTIIALNNFSIDIYENEITALLGHNGAGKTTLLSVITGMLSPTNGNVKTEDYNLFENLDKFRADLGYCPQNDLLLNNLTVAEHIILFGMVKGLPMREAIVQAKTIITKCRLMGKDNTRVSQLSGGMKRKLCLAVSLVNDPKLLILDEPTSGLDPESRRAIWDILLELRRNRTIILTTHFMEEADVLGDRIAIMSHGELKCYGTSMFLKKNYGSGYDITVLLKPGSTAKDIKKIKEIINNDINEVTILCESLESIKIQVSLSSVDRFPQLFEKLENYENVTSLAVACTTIDDVFQKVNEEAGVKFSVDEVDMPIPVREDSYSTLFKRRGMLFWQRLCAIKDKKLIWIYRNWVLACLYLLLPLILVVIATYKTSESASAVNLQPLLLDLQIYGKTKVVLANNHTNYGKAFVHEVDKTESVIIKKDNVIDGLLEFGREDEGDYRMTMIVAGDMSEKDPTVLYSSIAIHSIPLAVNLMSNILINKDMPTADRFNITTYNDPYSFSSNGCVMNAASEIGSRIAYTIIIILELTFVITFFMIHVHIERSTFFKELQLLTGLRYYFYWLFTFLIDIIIYVCIILLLLTIMIIFDTSSLIRAWNVSGNFLLIFTLFGISAMWSAYFYSYFFKTYNGSTVFYTIITLTLCIAGIIITSFDGYEFLTYIFYLNPLNPLSIGFYKVMYLAQFNKMCEICTGPSLQVICSDSEARNSSEFNKTKELLYLGLDWIFYMFLIYLIDAGIFSFIWNFIKSFYIGKIPTSERPLDPDVFDEKNKIKDLRNQPVDENQVLIVDSLAKKYSRNITAVKDVTFGATAGQCFGLLGTNGAGKSTTFQMLTAFLRPTNGDASVNMFTLMKNKNQYRDQIGYCPQSGGLLSDLTGKETLKLFAALNGEPANQIETIVQKWINLLALKEYENRITSTYSGGNLRKLSTAIALIGSPPVVFLDEPTSGVDPVTRRKIWQVLKMSLNKNQTIVIASHSMDECEALCDRLTIMVEGTMYCIGNVQYLKKTYGKGYTILIKLGIISADTLKELKQKMEVLFTHLCMLKDEHKGLLHYHLEDPSCKWSTLFKNMSEMKQQFTAIEDYVLTDASLEQVFLNFASEK